MDIFLIDDFSHVKFQVVLIYLDSVFVVSPNVSILTVQFQDDTGFSLVGPWVDLHSFSLLEPFGQMIQRFFKQLSLHSFSSALNHSSVSLNLLNSTEIPCQLTCNNFSLLTLLKVDDCGNFLLFHLLKSLAVLSKGSHLCGKNGALLDFFEFIKPEVQDNQPTFLNVNSGCERDINVSKRILIIKELLGGSHMLRVVSSWVNKPSQDFLGFFEDFFFISHLGSELLDLDKNFLDIDSGH